MALESDHDRGDDHSQAHSDTGDELRVGACRGRGEHREYGAGWMLKEPLRPKPTTEIEATARIVTAKGPNDVWHIDLGAVPISSGFWTARLPWALAQQSVASRDSVTRPLDVTGALRCSS